MKKILFVIIIAQSMCYGMSNLTREEKIKLQQQRIQFFIDNQHRFPGDYGYQAHSNSLVQPIYNDAHRQTNNVYSTVNVGSSLKDLPEKTHAFGLTNDVPAEYNHATYQCSSFRKKIKKQFTRNTNHSTLFVLRYGNTYEEDYIENNRHSTLFEFALYNKYKKDVVLQHNHSTLFRLNILDDCKYKNENGTENHSTNIHISIGKKELAFMALATCYATGLISIPGIIFASKATLAIGATGIVVVGGTLLPMAPLLLLIYCMSSTKK